MQDIKVSETLRLELSTVKGPQVRVVRRDGGLVAVELSEVQALIGALAEAAALLAAAEADEDYEGDLF